jgi:uncharacterized integral membrane protein (TIGR00697 family)
MFNELVLLGHVLFLSFMAFVNLRIGAEALATFTIVTGLLGNLFVLKQTDFLGLQATTADALAVGSILGFNLIQEFYGQRLGHKIILISFVMTSMYIVLTQIQLLYVPSDVDTMQYHFDVLLGRAPLIAGGGMMISILSQILDFFIYGFLRRTLGDRFLALRNYIAIALTQILDTLLSTILLYKLGVIVDPVGVYIVSFTIKFGITLLATPLVTTMASWWHPKPHPH